MRGRIAPFRLPGSSRARLALREQPPPGGSKLQLPYLPGMSDPGGLIRASEAD
jgi:hypothetical protein